MDRSSKYDFLLTDYARNLIRYKAWQLRQRHDFHLVDAEDLQHDLWLTLTSNAHRFNPAKASLDTFIDRVVNTAVAMTIRARRRKKRGTDVCIQSLDSSMVRQGDTVESLAFHIAVDYRRNPRGDSPPSEVEQRETAEALEHAFAQMPADLASALRRVMGGSVASATRDLGMTPRQMKSLLAQAEPFLERSGLNPSFSRKT